MWWVSQLTGGLRAPCPRCPTRCPGERPQGGLLSPCAVSGGTAGGTVFCTVSCESGISFSRLYQIHSLFKALRPQLVLAASSLLDPRRCPPDC